MANTDAKGLVEHEGLDSVYPVSDEQVDQLWEVGWTLVPGLAERALADEIRAHLAKGQELSRPAGFAGADSFEVKTALTRREGMCWKDPFLRSVATSRRVASAVLRFMRQPTALLAHDMSFNKTAGGGVTRLHQDLPYHPWDRVGGVTVWISLVDQSADTGPIHFLERSHREGPLGFADPSVDLLDTYPQLRSLDRGGPATMSAGDATVHFDLVVHGSDPNTTDSDREAWALRYMRADTVYNGVSHQHYDPFAIAPGTPFADTGHFALIGPDGAAGA